MRARSATAALMIRELTGLRVIDPVKMARAVRVWDLIAGVRRVRAGRAANVDVAAAAAGGVAAVPAVVVVRVAAEIRVAAGQTPACHLNRAADRVDTSGARGMRGGCEWSRGPGNVPMV